MSDWIKTKAGLQMAETVIRYLPRITVCLEEIALSLNYLRRLENDEKKRIVNTPVGKDSELSYVLTKDIKKMNETIKKTPEYKRGKSIISSIGYRGES